MRCAMKRFDRTALYGCAAAILLAVLAWPSAGWSRAHLQVCEVNDVQHLLDNWASALKQAWQPPGDPMLIVNKYAVTGAVAAADLCQRALDRPCRDQGLFR
jgi:hypothetical protein